MNHVQFFEKTKSILPGMLFMQALAIIAIYMGSLSLLKTNGMSPLTLAIVLGLLLGNLPFIHIPKTFAAGIHITRTTLLRLGIILYGFRITFAELKSIGLEALFVDVIMLALTLTLGVWIGKKVLHLDHHTAVLTAAGSAICGAAAVIATEGILQSQPKKATAAVATVVLFGTVSMFLYPFIFTMGYLEPGNFGVYIGSTIHEVAQVVVAGEWIGGTTATTAVIVKMARVILLAPFLLLLEIYSNPKKQENKNINEIALKRKVTIPWFAILFLVMILLNSLFFLPDPLKQKIIDLDTLVLAAAMGALGLKTSFRDLKDIGLRPFILGGILFLFLTAGGLWINFMILTR